MSAGAALLERRGSTVIRRIELALTAQRRAELDELTADLPDQGRLTRLFRIQGRSDDAAS